MHVPLDPPLVLHHTAPCMHKCRCFTDRPHRSRYFTDLPHRRRYFTDRLHRSRYFTDLPHRRRVASTPGTDVGTLPIAHTDVGASPHIISAPPVLHHTTHAHVAARCPLSLPVTSLELHSVHTWDLGQRQQGLGPHTDRGQRCPIRFRDSPRRRNL
jgi:hypothetical protein